MLSSFGGMLDFESPANVASDDGLGGNLAMDNLDSANNSNNSNTIDNSNNKHNDI